MGPASRSRYWSSRTVFGYRLRKGENIRIFDGLSLDVKYAEFIGIARLKL